MDMLLIPAILYFGPVALSSLLWSKPEREILPLWFVSVCLFLAWIGTVGSRGLDEVGLLQFISEPVILIPAPLCHLSLRNHFYELVHPFMRGRMSDAVLLLMFIGFVLLLFGQLMPCWGGDWL